MIEYRTLPVPAFDQYTARFDAGPVVFGVEYRVLNEATILEFYGDDARSKFDNKVPAGMGAVIEEDGLALHVFAHDGRELLRFDCFDDAPHYHYLDPTVPRNIVIEHDAVASGPIIPWAFHTLRTRLGAMLTHIGAGDLAAALHQPTVDATLDLVEAEAARMLAVGAPVAVAARS